MVQEMKIKLRHRQEKQKQCQNVLPALRSLIIAGIFLVPLCLLKLIIWLLSLNLFINFLVCLVSSQAIRETFFKIFKALKEISSKLSLLYFVVLSRSASPLAAPRLAPREPTVGPVLANPAPTSQHRAAETGPEEV